MDALPLLITIAWLSALTFVEFVALRISLIRVRRAADELKRVAAEYQWKLVKAENRERERERMVDHITSN